MNIKTILSLLGKTFLTFLIICIAVYIFGFFAFGDFMKNSLSQFITVLPFIIPFLFIPMLVFHYINQEMVLRKMTHKIVPYFSFTILIPTLTSGIVSVVTTYILKGDINFFTTLNQMLMLGIIVLFFALLYYIKHNYSHKSKEQSKILDSVKTPYTMVVLYAIGLSFLNSIFHSIMLYDFSLHDFLLEFVDSIILAIICWYLVYIFNRYVEKKLSSSTMIIISIVLIVVCLQPIITGIKYVQMSIFGIEGIPFTRFAIHDLVRFNLLQSIFVIFAVLFYQFLYVSKIRSVEQKTFKATLGKQNEKYKSLRRQLSPHFLFNNINVLTALIEENPQKAARFSESLGNIYRHFLRQEDEDIVALESALEFSKDYLELLKYRYEEAFQYTLPETVQSHQYIIPLALQQVIENTIKHNEVSKEKPLRVDLKIQDDYIIIQNTKQLKTVIETAKGTGIENMQKRYAFLTEKPVLIEDTDTSFTIKLPLLNMENA